VRAAVGRERFVAPICGAWMASFVAHLAAASIIGGVRTLRGGHWRWDSAFHWFSAWLNAYANERRDQQPRPHV
jgi:hypothetical protein